MYEMEDAYVVFLLLNWLDWDVCEVPCEFCGLRIGDISLFDVCCLFPRRGYSADVSSSSHRAYSRCSLCLKISDPSSSLYDNESLHATDIQTFCAAPVPKSEGSTSRRS